MSGENNGKGTTQLVVAPARLERAVDAIDRVLAGGEDVTIDFGTCDFITVDGIEWLEEILLRSESRNANVKFINLNPKLYKVFKVAHMDSLQKACGAPGPSVGPAC